jgi:hypothetical protein
MLADGKIDSLDTHLEQFKLNNRTAQSDLQVYSPFDIENRSSLTTTQNLLREYGQLLDDYKDLKKAFETKGSKSVAKATPKSSAAASTEKSRNPYVLVLIDGNGYIVNILSELTPDTVANQT